MLKEATELGKLLEMCRKAAGFTQEQLAMKMHRTQPSISKYEKGRKIPDFLTVMDWAKITNTQEAIAAFICGVDVSTIAQTVLQLVACVSPLVA